MSSPAWWPFSRPGRAEPDPLFGPYGGALCDGGGVVEGTEGGYGFAVITGTSTVKASVTLKDLSPNTTYYVRFIQGIPDCGDLDDVARRHGVEG